MPSLMLQLVVAHLAGDFLLQSGRDAQNKRNFRVLARHALVHALLLAGVGWLRGCVVAWEWGVLGLLWASHIVVDAVTSRLQMNADMRLGVDQAAHLLALVLATQMMAPGELAVIGATTGVLLRDPRAWWIVAGLLVVVWAGGVVVGRIVQPYATKLAEVSGAPEGMESAGRIIGKCERTLIFLFLLTGHEAVIGFVIAAKALMRLPEARDRGSRASSEYYLVGTLVSVSWAVACGLMLRAWLKL